MAWELLERYRGSRDEEAFRRLVDGHVDLVYSVARRLVADSHLAEDVTQTVFALLAREAGRLRAGTNVAGWLFNATRFTAKNLMRSTQRRRRREREVAQMKKEEVSGVPDEGLRAVIQHLDAGLERLGAGEREAVLLRFYQGMSLKQAGDVLGIDENAVAKRVSRAMEKLREYYAGKGITTTAAALSSTLASAAVDAAPVGLGAAASEAALSIATPVSVEAGRVARLWLLAKIWPWAAVAVLTIMTGTAALLIIKERPQQTRLELASVEPDILPAATLRKNWGPQWTGFPIAPGWPLGLPGEVSGSPALADVDGDGDLEIIVPSIDRGRPDRPTPVLHPRPRLERLLYAFHHDGTLVKGWPAVITDRERRLRERNEERYADSWASSPSVMDVDGGRDKIFLLAKSGTWRVDHEPSVGAVARRLVANGDSMASVPLADINADGKTDLIAGWVLKSADGGKIPSWPESRILRGGFAPCIGDANGDGRLEVYHPFYTDQQAVGGFDFQGNPLSGWPQRVHGQVVFAPVMGDMTGDGLMEVIAIDTAGNVHVWQWNGEPTPGTRSDGEFTSVFPSRVSPPMVAPTLADLDGDGAAELIVYDQPIRAIRAWRGDGSGFSRPDGILARLPPGTQAKGVSVVDLGDDRILDLFCGAYWIRVDQIGQSSITPLMPGVVESDTQPTIADIDRDGRAEVLFGLKDGQVFIYQTGLSLDPRNAQWPTASGNMRRTGAWISPMKAAATQSAGTIR